MFKKKFMTGYTLIIAGSVTVICATVFVFFGANLFLDSKTSTRSDIEFEAEQTQVQSEASSDKISIPGFETWAIDSGKTKVSTNFYNPENNNCYFIVKVILDDTGETIYESKYIKPGQHLYEVELLKALDKGKYQATIHYSAFETETLTPLNGANVPFELVVN